MSRKKLIDYINKWLTRFKNIETEAVELAKLKDQVEWEEDTINQLPKGLINLKYIDPSYIVRSSPAEPTDAAYCARLGSNAVHAAMSGKTRCILGLVNNNFVHIPTEIAVSKRNFVDPEGSLWRDVLLATSQPPIMKN